MQDVANGLEPCEIPLLPGAPASALQELQDSFEYITDWILPSGVRNTLQDDTTLEEDDGLHFVCGCEESPCDGRNIECTCVIDYGRRISTFAYSTSS